MPESSPTESTITGHGGRHAVAAATAHGVTTMFTLSGAHVFPLYDAAVTSDPPLRIVDVRHEQTAVFAAEATAKLTRTPGLAVLTAGPGVTNGISAITSAWFNGSPVVVVGGRAPAARWGSGALQELDHPPLVASVTKSASTIFAAEAIGSGIDDALQLAATAHRGPVFLDIPMDVLFSEATAPAPWVVPDTAGSRPVVPGREPDPSDLDEIARLLGESRHPVLVLGSDVWTDDAVEEARRFVDAAGIPVIANGMGRGILAPNHPLLVTRARSRAFGQADLVIVAGTPLDFRLGYGHFGGRDGSAPASVVHLVDSPTQFVEVRTRAFRTSSGAVGNPLFAGAAESARQPPAASAAGDLRLVFTGLLTAWGELVRQPDYSKWAEELRQTANAAVARDAVDLDSNRDPIHPARVYRELINRLESDAIVAGDGGDFVSFAGRYLEPAQPGGWLDPGPYGCLGTGLGYAAAARLARPSAQVALLLGDGAAGFSLMDVDTLVRHDLPAVMIVGNNGAWGLEKHPMRFLYGYDVAAELRQETRYDEVVKALGGAGETVARPTDIGPALDRAFASRVPYLINVLLDPDIAYPRTTTGV
jgi:acetolactate synthase-1/2/3 large subunit